MLEKRLHNSNPGSVNTQEPFVFCGYDFPPVKIMYSYADICMQAPSNKDIGSNTSQYVVSVDLDSLLNVSLRVCFLSNVPFSLFQKPTIGGEQCLDSSFQTHDVF